MFALQIIPEHVVGQRRPSFEKTGGGNFATEPTSCKTGALMQQKTPHHFVGNGSVFPRADHSPRQPAGAQVHVPGMRIDAAVESVLALIETHHGPPSGMGPAPEPAPWLEGYGLPENPTLGRGTSLSPFSTHSSPPWRSTRRGSWPSPSTTGAAWPRTARVGTCGCGRRSTAARRGCRACR